MKVIVKLLENQTQEVRNHILMYLIAKNMVEQNSDQLEIIIEGARIEIKMNKL